MAYTQNFISFSNYGYCAIGKQSTADAVIPTNFLRITTEKLMAKFNITAIDEVAGSRIGRRASVQGQIDVDGPVSFYVEENMAGHFMNNIYGTPTKQVISANVAYRYGWDVQTGPNTYTVDMAPANAPWVHRFFNCYGTKFDLSQKDNAIEATTNLMPTKAFIVSNVLTTVASGTNLNIDQTEGLVATDQLLVIDQTDYATILATLTVSAIVDATNVTVSTIGVSLPAGSLVMIKRNSSASYSQDKPFQFHNGTAIYTGLSIDNLTEVVSEDFKISLTSDAEAHFGSGQSEAARYPYAIVVKKFDASSEITHFYDDDRYLNWSRLNTRLAVRYNFQGRVPVYANSAAAASSTWGASNGFSITANAAGRAGNDISVTTVINTADTLAVSRPTTNQYLIKLANTTAASNTGTLIAAAINGLSSPNVTAAAIGTGATQFTTAENSVNLGFRSSGTNVVGLDASQMPYLQFDFPSGYIKPFSVNNDEGKVIMQTMAFDHYYDEDVNNNLNKKWDSRVFLYTSNSTLA